MSTLEKLLEKVVCELRSLTKDNLLKVCDFLKISGEERAAVETNPHISLVTHVMKYLEREEGTELEDEGMSVLLPLKDKITGLTTSKDNRAGMERETEQHKEVKIQQPTPVYSTVNESPHQSQPILSPQVTVHRPC